MKRYSADKRRMLYLKSIPGKKWPDSAPWVGKDGRLYGMWILGQDYRSKTGYYGSFPPNFLDRVMALFPDAKHKETLHLFSGSLPKGTKGLRVDINPKTKPDIVADAHELSTARRVILPGRMEQRIHPSLIIADPPYSDEDAKRYGTAMIKRNVVLRECAKVLRPHGWIVWLDQVLPMYRKDQLRLAGAIGVVRSTNHRFRVVSFFRKAV